MYCFWLPHPLERTIASSIISSTIVTIIQTNMAQDFQKPCQKNYILYWCLFEMWVCAP